MPVRTIHEQKNESLYFITFTCYKWLHLFEKGHAYDLVYHWFDYLLSRNVMVTGFVIMPNHVHLLLYFNEMNSSITKVIGNGKRFLAYGIIKRLIDENNHDLLLILENGETESERRKGQLHKVFQTSFDAKLCFSARYIDQKINYIHKNPINGKWNLANDIYSYPHSSASFYEFGECIYGNLMRVEDIM